VLDPDQLAVLRSIGPDDGLGLLQAVAELFLGQAPQLLGDLRRAATEDDPETLRGVAHHLKGSAANVGAVRVAALCQELESAAAGSTTGGGRGDVRLLDDLAAELDRVRLALRDLLEP
jgi:two-component system sensor histidine kinase/response regulator